MKGSTRAVTLAFSLMPTLALAQAQGPGAAQATTNNIKREVTLQGCVTAGVDKGTVALTQVKEIAPAGQSVMPAEAHGRRTVFWLMPDTDLAKNVGHMVQVRGKTTKIEESEIELKAGHQTAGGLVVEFEGPGKDVKLPNDVIGSTVGTAGRTAPEKSDIKTFLIRVNVENVQSLEGTCR
jgi:hypothetical protein